jgi:hypothetical protein
VCNALSAIQQTGLARPTSFETSNRNAGTPASPPFPGTRNYAIGSRIDGGSSVFPATIPPSGHEPCQWELKPIASGAFPARICAGSIFLRTAQDAPVAQLDRAPDYESGGRRFESFRARHFGTKLGTPKPAVFALEAATSVPQQLALGARDTNFFRADFDALSERAEVIATVAARLGPHPLAGSPGECFESLRCGARPDALDRALIPVCTEN